MAKKPAKPAKKPGPAPDVLKLDMPWGDAMKKALTKKKPAKGWPKK